MVVPEGFALPPLVYLVPTVALLAIAGGVLWRRRPEVTDPLIVALVPWMIAGGAAHVVFVVGGLPDVLAPLFGVPAVYLTMAAAIATVWALAELNQDANTSLSASDALVVTGSAVAAVAIAIVVWWGLAHDVLAPQWAALSVIASIIVASAVWFGIDRLSPATAAVTGWTGALVIFAHTFDGISTMVGIDVLGGGERTPLADIVLGIGARLPTAHYLGEAWLFVVIKVALAVGIVVLFREFLREDPTTARLLLAVIAAVGLGPAVHNVLLFSIAG